MRLMVASSSRGTSSERQMRLNRKNLPLCRLFRLCLSVRISVKDKVAHDGWLVLLCPGSKGWVVSQSLLQKLIVYIPDLSCEYYSQGYLWWNSRHIHDLWQDTLCKTVLSHYMALDYFFVLF